MTMSLPALPVPQQHLTQEAACEYRSKLGNTRRKHNTNKHGEKMQLGLKLAREICNLT